MRIVDSGDSFELHISSSITDNIIHGNGKEYVYKRLVIPHLLMDYFFSMKKNLSFLYVYFLGDHVYLSCVKVHGIKFSKGKIQKLNNKNTFFINLNTSSFSKHDIIIRDNVLFVLSSKTMLNDNLNVCIELFF